MNVYMEVHRLLVEAQKFSWIARQTEDYPTRISLYQTKAARISAAVLADPAGWYLDGYKIGAKLAAITYRGCWWFHVPIDSLPEAVSAILFDRNVTWVKREDQDVEPQKEDNKDSWPIPDPNIYFRNGY